MPTLPRNLYRAAQVRELDRLAIEEYAIPGATLMERAGAAAFAALQQRWPQSRNITLVCGIGNNGGDGFIVARLAYAAGLTVQVLQVGDVQLIRGDALAARQALLQAGVAISAFSAAGLQGAELIVDAMLGTGLTRGVEGEWRAAIEAINQSGLPILALDIPSGLQSDSGQVLGAAVRAHATISFIGLKQGMLSGAGPDYCGALLFDDLGVPEGVYARLSPAAVRINLSSAPSLAARARNSHKGSYGQVLVIGGDHGMAGAVRLAAEAAVRVGAGLVRVATRGEHLPGIIGARPELLCHGVENVSDLGPLFHTASVIAIGPGLGRSAWASELFGAVLETNLPLVVDADALNLLATDPLQRQDWILTPHPGEAARLLNSSIAEVQADRFQAAQEIQRRYGGVVVLKGAGTLVQAGSGPTAVCDAGNPGMASAGMGDVLTGVIAGLLAQGMEIAGAAQLGVCLHAAAGDRAAAREGERGLLASDLFPHLRRLVNQRTCDS